MLNYLSYSISIDIKYVCVCGGAFWVTLLLSVSIILVNLKKNLWPFFVFCCFTFKFENKNLRKLSNCLNSLEIKFWLTLYLYLSTYVPAVCITFLAVILTTRQKILLIESYQYLR